MTEGFLRDNWVILEYALQVCNLYTYAPEAWARFLQSLILGYIACNTICVVITPLFNYSNHFSI